MSSYRYILQPYGTGNGTRFTCPNCHKKRQFTRYIDVETGQHLHETVGSCNRESKCGYHYPPKQYFIDNPDQLQATKRPWEMGLETSSGGLSKELRVVITHRMDNDIPQPVSYIPMEKLRESRKHYNANHFALFLRSRFGKETAEQLILRYHIGTSKKWPGATIFWQIDQEGKVRTGKIMLYDAKTGKRIQKPFSHLTWVHKAQKQEEFNLKQCLFGEHLLRLYPNKPVALAESEKTAIICSHYLPKYIWLATGSMGNLSRERCQVLKDRNVTLFPDLGGYEAWREKAEKLRDITSFTVSDFLERIANEEQRENGLDIADFLLTLPTSP